MRDWQSLAHVKWECKYSCSDRPKYRRKLLFGHVRKRIGKISSNYVGRRRLSWWRAMRCWTMCIWY